MPGASGSVPGASATPVAPAPSGEAPAEVPVTSTSPLPSQLNPYLSTCEYPGTGPYQAISLAGIHGAAALWRVSTREAMARCLDAGVWPLRFKANRGLLSAGEQATLLRRHAAVIGCGGLGGYLITLLARMGVGACTVCDGDCFDESNLNRQLLCREDRLGVNKALAAKAELALVASHVAVTAVMESATAANLPDILAPAHVAVDCLDSVAVRLVLERAAEAAGIPYIHGSLAGLEGFALAARPGDRPMTRLYGAEILSEPGMSAPMQGAEKRAGTPTPIPAAVAALQTVLTVRALLAEAKGDVVAGSFSESASALWHLDLAVPSLEVLLL